MTIDSQKWIRKTTLSEGKEIILRPIKPEDRELLNVFFQKCDPEDMRQRLFHAVRTLPQETAVILTRVDDHTMSFVALEKKTGDLLGMTQLVANPDHTRAEYAVITRSDMKQKGIGTVLTDLLIEYAQSEGISELWGQVMRDNTAMLKICHTFGIRLETDEEDPVYLMATLSLRNQAI